MKSQILEKFLTELNELLIGMFISALCGFGIYLLWNYFIGAIFGLSQISFWGAWACRVMIQLLFTRGERKNIKSFPRNI